MSGGRVELGLGAGWYEAEHQAYAIPFPPLGERFERLEEQLAIITGLWAHARGRARSTSPGRTTRSSARRRCPSRSSSRPPIIVGGGGPKRTPRLAATYAAEFNLPFAPIDVFTAQTDRVRQACEAIGRDPATMTFSAALVAVLRRATRPRCSRRAAAIGRQPDELRTNGAAGTPDEVVATLQRWAEAGATRIYLQVLDLSDLDHLRAARQRGHARRLTARRVVAGTRIPIWRSIDVTRRHRLPSALVATCTNACGPGAACWPRPAPSRPGRRPCGPARAAACCQLARRSSSTPSRTAQPGSRSWAQSAKRHDAASSSMSAKAAGQAVPSPSDQSPTERIPGVSIRMAPPASTTSSPAVVVWRPRPSPARARRRCPGRSAPARAFTSVDLPDARRADEHERAARPDQSPQPVETVAVGGAHGHDVDAERHRLGRRDLGVDVTGRDRPWSAPRSGRRRCPRPGPAPARGGAG